MYVTVIYKLLITRVSMLPYLMEIASLANSRNVQINCLYIKTYNTDILERTDIEQ